MAGLGQNNSVSRRVERKDEICPRCGGDGGVRGGCYKCDGTGWVTHSARVGFRSELRVVGPRGELSRISNADYLGGNRGAFFRDRDGRIGSFPSHDDYSDDGVA